ncbi:hypothetical protein COS51_04390 [Candidatus Roizmanbacteria bacterium CG03_land_8_20_14_0_80_36_21]|nr:MAG: hypothetical protein COS51_04390 [Candidatus Roizmanbacteria bacterium CG03_land_8_20_14_0_80_36_21]
MAIIIFILILTSLVLVHELGHFIAAKRNGILVEEFGFGYPPRIFGIKIGETLYSLNLIPLGGFVKLYGEEYQEKLNKKIKNRSFVSKKPLQKTLVIVAGIIGNFLLGWVLISYLFINGVPVPTNKVIIDKVVQNSPAYYVGLKKKDVILKLENTSLTTTNALISLTKKYAGQSITLAIQRNNQVFPIIVTPRKNPPKDEGSLGIIITSFEEKKYTWYQAPFYGLIEASNITKTIITELSKTLYQFITFKKPTVEVAGPIGIAHFTSEAIKFGKNAVLELMALLSLNLAVVNLLPFPALDGGKLIMVVYEAITKRRVNPKLEKELNLIGFFILLAIAVLISVHDIIKIYK